MKHQYKDLHFIATFSSGAILNKMYRSRDGFALVVTLTLMVLLAILAVGLLSLSSIALRSNSRDSALIHARANARMALMIAVGELQKHTGPDQRVTASANIAANDSGELLASGADPANIQNLDGTQNNVSSVQPGTRFWSGVWKNQDNPSLAYEKTPSAELVQWLVSGNEGDLAEITPATGGYGLDTSGRPTDPDKAVLMVGEFSASPGADPQRDFVSAPLVEVKDEKSPGRYAWWIGDEAAKAKLNIVANYNDGDQADETRILAQRSGWEAVAGMTDFPSPGSGAISDLHKVLTSAQLPLFSNNLQLNGESLFHAASTHGYGVLSDTAQGGLRLDLSNYLRGTLPSNPPAGMSTGLNNGISIGQNIIPQFVAPNLKGPKWNQLKNFQELVSGNTLPVRAADNNEDIGIAPLIVELRLLCGAKLEPEGGDENADNYHVYPSAKIAVTLANPYSYPLEWGSDFYLYLSPNDPNRGSQASRIWPAVGRPAFFAGNPSESAVFHDIYFRIPAQTLEPGEARAFTLGSPVEREGRAQTITDLVPIDPSHIQDFRNSVILRNNYLNSVTGTDEIHLDVREGSTSSQINVELRDGVNLATSKIYRRIERFELDNAEFSPNQRRVTKSDAKQLKEPFALQLFTFQLSQPGADYAQFLPSPSLMGIRSSTMRTFADFNLQATRIRKPIISYNPAPYFMTLESSYHGLPYLSPGYYNVPRFSQNLAITPVRWGNSANGSERTVLFSPPSPDEDLASLAQFQHADLTADDVSVSIGHQPGNAFANSYASPFVKRELTQQQREDYLISNQTNASTTEVNYFDISYLLNVAMWDSYFFSTLGGTNPRTPQNPRITRLHPTDISPELMDGEKAAAHLLVNGAFNINSTSKAAWQALLAGNKHLRYPAGDATDPTTNSLFPRSLRQPMPGGLENPSGMDADSFSGYRRLSDSQIEILAEAIVRQVRLRGPFLSIAHFVNRGLATITENPELGRSGALQSALDESGINISQDGSRNAFTDIDPSEDLVRLQADGSGPLADLTGVRPTKLSASIWPVKSRDENPGSVASILADQEILHDPEYRPEQGYRSTGIPGWLTQADLLQAIGPVISARSDAFVIRAYGDSRNSDGDIVARAWCEAKIQRLPEYVDSTQPPEVRGSNLNPVNSKYGRRYQITSFRWLSPNEI